MIKERKGMRLLVAASMIATMAVTAFTPITASADSIKPRIDEVEYRGSGVVRVEWDDDVRYRNTSVTVKSGGKNYSDRIVRKTEEHITFDIRNFKKGKTYTFYIKNVRDEDHYRYYTIKGKVRIPAATNIYVEDIEYDNSERKVSFDFKYDVKWRSPKVTFTDDSGNTISSTVIKKDRDELDVRVAQNLEQYGEYTCTISGIKRYDASSYKTITRTFTAYDDDYYEGYDPSTPVVPGTGTVVFDKADYDPWERELELDFLYNVNLASAKVTITDSNGATVSTVLRSFDEDSIELYLSNGLTYGGQYTYKIENVFALGSQTAQTVSGTFYAVD